MELTNKQKKDIIIIIFSILLFIVLFLILVIAIISKESHQNYNIDIATGYSSIQEIIEHYNSRYISEFYDKSDEYPTSINVEFQYDLYDNDVSNEVFFNNVIADIAKFINYTNFIIKDEKKNITIQVVCTTNNIEKIIINNVEDYFIHRNSQLELSKFEEIEEVRLDATADILKLLISNSWESNIDFGSRDSIFQNYFIYFDEGIEYRKIGSTVYNIVFTEKYQGYVVNEITPNSSLNSVKATLGKPTFEDNELDVIGYKGNDFYAFFNGKEISIYKNIKYDYTEFWRLVDKFIDEDNNVTFKDFMNELTYIWKDYSEYKYDSDYMFISYPNKGIDIKLNYNDVSGIIIYNNISENLNRVSRYLKLDDIFETEKRRLKKNEELKEACKQYQEYMKDNYTKEDLELIGESSVFNYYFDLDSNGNTISVYFISKEDNSFKKELNEPIYRYFWLDENRVLYSIYGKGLYIYDVLTGEKITLIEGKDNFYIKSYEGNVITYDNTKIVLQFN